MRSLIVSLGLALATATAVHAQPTAKKDYVQRIMTAQQGSIENVGRALAAQTSQQVLEAAGQALGQIPADKQEAVGKAMQDDVKKFYDEIEPNLKQAAVRLAPGSIGTMLEEKFNEDELRQIATWVESPVARKYAQLTGDLQESLTRKLVEDTRTSVEGKLKTLEDALRKRLEAAGASTGGDAKPAAKPAPPKKK